MKMNKMIFNLNTKKFFKTIQKSLKELNESKLLLGLSMLMLNIGSKYIELNITKTQEAYIKSVLSRELFIFTIIFIGTHDIVQSILMTAAFSILAYTAFNENSKFCIMSDRFKKLHNVIDLNKDNEISDNEISKAYDILYKANSETNKINQLNS